MKVNLYTIRIDSYRLVAAEVAATTAAELLDEARPVLLATQAELAQIARQHHKALVIFSPQHGSASYSRRPAPDSLAGTRHAAGRLASFTGPDRRPVREPHATPAGVGTA
ncbi:MAG: hypothetical protein ABFD16_01920 [Thermoguttaceae bacterium]